MPKIMMDGDVPRINSPLSAGARQPKIMMDEGYERRSQADDDDTVSRPVSVVETTEVTETAATNGSADVELKQDDIKDSVSSEAKDTNSESNKDTTSTTEVDPANVELPKSPAPEEVPSTLSVIAPETKIVPPVESEEKAESTAAETANAALPSSRKQYSADVLLPLLIFSVVKSNPPMLISNLRYAHTEP